MTEGEWERVRSDGVVSLSYFVNADAPMMAAGDADPEHRLRFDFPDDFVPTTEHAENVIARWEQERRLEERFPFAVSDDRTGELLGGCELLPLDDDAANLSFWTYPGLRGRGVATRAVALICDQALEEMEFRRLEIVTDEDNAGARKVALQSGFEERGHLGERLRYVFPATAFEEQ